ncbi:hypothetical protein DSO57_1003677 [Entomophthora muscae]|uniref:Uncharacterized protein n=1 Tax=Entomophthora muscae TaxID=34485 RepID=A0ACC2T8K3_9FUNG|nr:hypothetical protein DSO57_1003677 [Entomophthora muscae]
MASFQLPLYPMLDGLHNVPSNLHIPLEQESSLVSTSPTKSDGFEFPLLSSLPNENESLALLLKVLCLSSCQGLTQRDIDLIMSFYQYVPSAGAMLDIKYLTKLLLLQPLTGTVRALLAVICSVVLYTNSAFSIGGDPTIEAAAYFSFASSYVQFNFENLADWEVECFQYASRFVNFIIDGLFL